MMMNVKKKKKGDKEKVEVNEKDAQEEKDQDAINAVKNIKDIKDWVRVLKTDFIFNKSSGLNFNPINIKMTDFCSNNKMLPIRLNMYCY